ncbi:MULTISPECIES: tyrosine-type recombinase/integrase [Cohnella]|uniref:tyrosine-type recombinase/integrase n=1 Tax=Cohnella TaxID=329857 RepID=UPI001454BEE0|nr:tyrosine-type recombinase/integrase [Cohnella fermenti]
MNSPVKRRTNRVSTQTDRSFSAKASNEEWIDLFLQDCRSRNLSQRSIAYYDSTLRYLLQVLEEQQQCADFDQITADNLQRHFLGYMLGKQLAPQTINGRLSCCRIFFRFLHQHQHIPTNPASALTSVKAPKDAIATFSQNELVRLLRQPDQSTFTGLRDYTILLLLLDTGIRIGELLGLRVNDLHMQERELRVMGKGAKERRVPFQKTCAKSLRSYLAERGNLPTPALFVSIDNQPLQIRSLQERIHDYGLMAKVTGVRVSPHTFRHTMAKMYIRNGGDPFSLQLILGHSCLDMVQIYVRLFNNEVREQHRKYSPVEHAQIRRRR